MKPLLLLLTCLSIAACTSDDDDNNNALNQVGDWEGIRTVTELSNNQLLIRDTVTYSLFEDFTGRWNGDSISNWQVIETQDGRTILEIDYAPRSGFLGVGWPSSVNVTVDQPNVQEWSGTDFNFQAQASFDLERR